MSKTLVTLRFQKASPFTVCFSSKAPVGYEKFGVYSFSLNNLYVGSPNIGTLISNKKCLYTPQLQQLPILSSLHVSNVQIDSRFSFKYRSLLL
jgi:hypothetical protein